MYPSRVCFRVNVDHGVWTGLLACIIFLSWAVVEELAAGRRRMLACDITIRTSASNTFFDAENEMLLRTTVHYGTALLCTQIVTAVVATLGLMPFAILRAYSKRYHDVRTQDRRCVLSVRDVTLLKHVECWTCFLAWTASVAVFTAYEFFPFDTLQALYKDTQLCAMEALESSASFRNSTQVVFRYESCDGSRETPRAGALIAVNAASCLSLYALSVYQMLTNCRDVAKCNRTRDHEQLPPRAGSDTEFD
ncbi:hypothetical protein CYMTET_53764 [Cymbomonas tetramitiformis]|uniref:Uncharacterized protein n=1 Tax=Cymbomonas tetramitiformis TaxID=36881 RepID=A0AAE0EPE5_9CHLO|nr:hypothetical protein CYMTET_53764 [Cymbomonas tetramitiformis]